MRNQDLEKQLTMPSKILALRSSEKASHSLFSTDCFHRGNDFNLRCPKGLSTFFVDGVNPITFLFGSKWDQVQDHLELFR